MPRKLGNIATRTGLSVLLLTGLILALAAQAARQQSAAGAPVTQANDAAAGRETFRARVRNELADWQIKMDAFEKRAGASGETHADKAEERLRKAWNRAEVEGGKVQTATAQDWDGVKASYQTASHKLAVAWGKVRL